jgi:hypothetical protein
MTEPNTDRLQFVRDGMADGRDMGVYGEIVRLFDAIDAVQTELQAANQLDAAARALEGEVLAASAADHVEFRRRLLALEENAGLSDKPGGGDVVVVVAMPSDGVVQDLGTWGQTDTAWGISVEADGVVA